MTIDEMISMEINTGRWVSGINAEVTRVHNGWIYKYYSHEDVNGDIMYHPPVYVPYRRKD